MWCPVEKNLRNAVLEDSAHATISELVAILLAYGNIFLDNLLIKHCCNIQGGHN